MTPSNHSVHIYSGSNDLILHLAGIVTSSLITGHAVVIVATGEHCQKLTEQLLTLGVDLPRYIADGMYVLADAAEALSLFMRDGAPVPQHFRASIGKLLLEARERTRSKDGMFTVFGEMVALLWEQGNQAAALELEELWNQSLQELPFRLYCGYPKRVFGNALEEASVASVHSCVLRDTDPYRPSLVRR